MRISNKSFNELIIITSLNTGSVKVIGSSPIRSTYKRFKALIFRAFSFSLMALLPTQKALYLYYFNSIHPPFPNKLN